MWRGRAWRKLYNLIDHLPRNCAYWEALIDDDEVADAILRGGSPTLEPRRRMSEYSPEVEALAAVVDRLTELLGVTLKANGAEPPQFTPYLRPVTAIDRAKVREQRRRHEDLVARVLPKG